MHDVLILPRAKVVLVSVSEELSKVVEFRDELL